MNVFRKLGVTGAALLIAGACLVVMGLFIVNDRATRTRDEAARQERRIANCIDKNELRADINDLADGVASILTLFNVPNPNRTPDTQAQVDAFFTQAHKFLTDAKAEPADCTPEALQ
jgi:hypothetical protein